MAAKKIKWQNIEQNYVRGRKTYAELCKKYDVSKSQLSAYASAHHWREKREKYREKVGAKTLEKIAEKDSDKLSRVGEAAEKMAQVIESCLEDPEQFQRRTVTKKDGSIEEVEVKSVNYGAIRQLTGALKDLAIVMRDVYNIPRETADNSIEVNIKLPEGANGFDV